MGIKHLRIRNKGEKKMEPGKQMELKNAALPVIAHDVGAWGTAPQLSTQDIKLPVLQAVQAMSDSAKAGKAKEGDFFDSSSARVIGNINDGLEIIPIHMNIVWHIFHYDKKAKKYLWNSKTPLETNPSSSNYNDKWKYEEVISVDGTPTEIKRERHMEFFVIVPKGDSSLPYQLTFKVTSIKAGKQLATQMYIENAAAGLVPPARAFILGGHIDKNDKGSFSVMDIKPSRNSTESEIASAFKWYKLILAGAVQVAEVKEEDISKPETGVETGEF